MTALTVLLGGVSQTKADFINGSFETGDFTGWTVGGTDGGHGVARGGTLINATLTGPPWDGIDSSFGPTYVEVRTGSFAAYTASGDSNGDFLSLSQTLTLAAGTYVVGYFLAADSPQFSEGYGKVGNAILVNGNDVLPLVPSAGDYINSTYSETSGQFMTSGGPTTIELHITGSGDGRAGISIDDAFLKPVVTSAPEPASLTPCSLAIAGAAGIFGWRRRKRTLTA